MNIPQYNVQVVEISLSLRQKVSKSVCLQFNVKEQPRCRLTEVRLCSASIFVAFVLSSILLEQRSSRGLIQYRL